MSPANVVEVFVEGLRTLALVDTGATISVISQKLCRSLRKVTTPPTALSLSTASAQRIHPIAACTAKVIIGDVLYHIEFIVLPSCSHDVILGWDFLSRHHAVIDCAQAQVELSVFDDAPSAHMPVPGVDKLVVAADTDLPLAVLSLSLYTVLP